jgi:uncharacterized protein (DUF2249 family)
LHVLSENFGTHEKQIIADHDPVQLVEKLKNKFSDTWNTMLESSALFVGCNLMRSTAHRREQNSSIGWGGLDSRAVCTATGHLCGVTFCKSKSNKWSKVLITSGNNDAWVIPTAARMLFSQVRAKKQGHRCILDGLNPGLIIGDSSIDMYNNDPKNQSGVFLGFAHRGNIYGAQILVDKAIITAKHQIAYDVELFPFQQRDNSNDRMQFFQSLLKRKTAPISDSALDNDHLNSDATAPYPIGITIDDSSDDEQVTNLMQDVDNLSKVPPFNILDSETRRSDVSLHVPPNANPNVDEEFIASPSQRRSSRHKRSSLSMDDSESLSSKPIAMRSKVIDKASSHLQPLLSLLINCG